MMIRRTRKPGTISTTVVCLLLSFVGIQGRPAKEVGKIDAKIVINFAAEQLTAELKYDYVAIEDHQDALVFYLNKAFDVKNVSCSLCQSFTFDTEAKPDPSLIIKLKKPLLKGKRLSINVDYSGSLKGIYKPDFKFLELGLDNFWFPIHPATVGFNFLYRLSIKTDEPGFDLVANGRSQRKDGGWLVESKVPDFDIDIVLGEGLQFKTYTQDGYDLKIVSKNMPEQATTTLLTSMKQMLDFYNSAFRASDRQRESPACSGRFRTSRARAVTSARAISSFLKQRTCRTLSCR